MNCQSEHIKLTREKPVDGWLPFLNVKVNISNGDFLTKWYRKPSNKNILVHFHRCFIAHPVQTKKAVIRNMFRTASSVCSGTEERKESLAMARMVAASNGYRCPPRRRGRRVLLPQQAESAVTEKIPFCVPFISDEVSIAIRRCLRKVGLDNSVSVVEMPPNNLKQLLIRNRLYDRICTTANCVICPNGRGMDCMTSEVICLISCEDCGEECIGETARPLCVRIKEHLDGKDRSRPSTPLGIHRVQKHEGANFGVKVAILAREIKTSARKTLEAFWIHAKNPKMNRKEECLSITRELAPYLNQLF